MSNILNDKNRRTPLSEKCRASHSKSPLFSVAGLLLLLVFSYQMVRNFYQTFCEMLPHFTFCCSLLAFSNSRFLRFQQILQTIRIYLPVFGLGMYDEKNICFDICKSFYSKTNTSSLKINIVSLNFFANNFPPLELSFTVPPHGPAIRQFRWLLVTYTEVPDHLGFGTPSS